MFLIQTSGYMNSMQQVYLPNSLNLKAGKGRNYLKKIRFDKKNIVCDFVS